MDERWYAIHTKPRCEEQVSTHLRHRGDVQVFLPKLAVSKRRRNRLVTAIEILFPSYLFVRMSLDPGRWYAVKWTRGVKSFVGTSDGPVPVPDEAIRLLTERCVNDEVIPWRPAFSAGSQVLVTYGAFAGFVGILEQPTTRKARVRVLLDLLGRQTPVEVDIADLEQVG